jgi:hypothetical protein
LEFAERPPIPVNATDKSAGKLPGFKARYYKTEEQLQSRPTQVKPNARSLWPGDKVTNPIYTPPKVLLNIGVAVQRSLLSINYFEYFAAVQQKALRVLRNDESQPEQKAAAVDITSRISASIGRCLEDITKQQAYILTSSTVVRRDATQQHKLPDDVSKWPNLCCREKRCSAPWPT